MNWFQQWELICERRKKMNRAIVATTVPKAGKLIGLGRWAFGEWKPLAEQGHAEAQFNLGILYAEGQGVAADKKEGIRWWRKAAELGNVDSQIYLGALYYDGLDLAKDYPRSYMWFKIAADSGDQQASNLRRVVADFMTSAQKTEARRLVQECRVKDFKGC